MSKRAGAIAMAVLVSGLLFSSAASARQTADSITVTGAVLGPAPNGTYVQFFSGNSAPYGNGTPFKQITFSGGSNFHFAGIEGAGGNCQLTQADGGITCTAAPEFPTLPNIWLNTLISGTLPTAVAGTVVYADDSTGTFTAPVGDVAPASYIPPRTDAIVNGTSIQISVGGALPPFLQFSLSGGSNWHVTAISGTGSGNCSLTPSNGGGSCTFATPTYGFVLNATFSGRRPNFVRGQLGYAHNVTLPWSYAVSCHCTTLRAGIRNVEKLDHGRKLGFTLKWKLDCTAGSSRSHANGCLGTLGVDQPRLPRGLRLRQANGQGWDGGRLTIHCHQQGGCARTTTGEKQFVLTGPVAARAGATVGFHLRLHCPSYGGVGGTRTTEGLTLAFDKHGSLDHNRSHLGRLG